MFERFTDRARTVIVLAQEEARGLGHNYIGTEHILLGLVHEGHGVAGKALEQLGISLDQLRTQIEEVVGRGQEAPSDHIPFTPRAKKVLELSLREALQLSHNYIGTEHILLGLIREGEGIAAQVLTRSGANLPTVRAEVTHLLGGLTAVTKPDPVSLEIAVERLVAELAPVLRSLLPDEERLGAAMELAVEAVLRRPHGVLAELVAAMPEPGPARVTIVEPPRDPGDDPEAS